MAHQTTGSTQRGQADDKASPNWMRPLRRLRLGTGVGALVTVLAVVSIIDVPREAGLLDGGQVPWWTLIALITAYASMGLAPWRPLTAATLSLAPLVIELVRNQGTGAEPYAIVPCLIAVAIRSRRWHLWLVCGVYALWVVAGAIRKQSAYYFGWSYGLLIFAATLIGLVARHFVVDRMADRRRLAELEAQNKRIRAEERELLAGELHDSVAHELTIITMQVMAHRDDETPDTMRTALDRVDRASRDALAELRTMVGLLRDQPDEAPPSATPERNTITQTADNVVETLTSEGFRPKLQLDIETVPIGSSLQNTISRLLKETSTNILRYAPQGAECTFSVAAEGPRILVDIRSPLPDTPVKSSLSNGWGLRGLRARIELTGGNLEAGPDDGQWIVRATLPQPMSLPTAEEPDRAPESVSAPGQRT